MGVYNATRSAHLAPKVMLADNFLTRLKGLLGKKELPRGWCLIIKPCRSVHTMFMAFPIDLLFLDKSNRVVAIYNGMPPFRVSRVVNKACLVMEFPSGTLAATGTATGDVIEYSR